jgi:hypothetical protein
MYRRYEFRWWARAFAYEAGPPTPVGFALEQALPTFIRETAEFPDLSFERFLELCQRAAAFYNEEYGCRLGLYTHGFLRFYCRRPEHICKATRSSSFATSAALHEMFDVTLLRTDLLNRQLYEFLLSMGYARDDVDFVLRLGRILPMGMGRREDQRWEKYYTAETKERVRTIDWLLFDVFPEFDV